MSEVIHRLLESMFGMEENLKNIFLLVYAYINGSDYSFTVCRQNSLGIRITSRGNIFLNSIKIIVF